MVTYSTNQPSGQLTQPQKVIDLLTTAQMSESELAKGPCRQSKTDELHISSMQETNAEIDAGLLDEPIHDGGWGWFVMIGCLMMNAMLMGFEKSSGVLYLLFKRTYGQTSETTSWAVSISITLTMILGPLASALCNRFTVRTVVTLGATLCSVGTFLSAFSPNIFFLYFSYGLFLGCGIALCYGPSLIILGQYFNKRRSLAAGIATSGAPLSICVFPIMLESLLNNYGFTGTFLILSGLVSHVYICAALYRPLVLHQRLVQHDRSEKATRGRSTSQRDRTRNLLTTAPTAREHKSEPDANTPYQSMCDRNRDLKHIQSNKNGPDSGGKQNHPSLLDLALLKNFGFLCLCIQSFFLSLSYITILTFLPALALEKGANTEQATQLVTVYGLCDFLFRVPVSILLDIEVIKPYRMIIYNLNIFSLAVITLTMPLLTTLWQLSIASGVFGIAIGLYLSQMSVVCVDLLGTEHLTSSFGLLLGFEGIGALVTPPIGGLIRDCLGSYVMAFYVGSIGAFVGGVAMAAGNVWLYRHKRQEYSEFQ